MDSSKKINIIRAKRRTLSLQVLPDATLVVKAPRFMMDWEIRRFIDSHEDWISRQMKRIERSVKVSPRTYADGEEFLYLGIPRRLTIGEYVNIEAQEGTLLYPRSINFRIRKELENWYTKQARGIITNRATVNAQAMNVSYLGIMFSDTKSKWGSCRHDNYLQFNWRLIMAPMIVLNYVVIHELVHILEKNHSQAFWRKVEQYNPSYKQQRRWLRDNGHSLVL